MSQPKLISPLLDNFLMGEPFSNHHGVQCCPAMKKNTDEKYIVKIISVPASQVQLDALLLTGAYPDKESAAVYFKEIAEGVVAESQTLQKLSQLEGFIPFDACQVVEMEDGTGYDVYLLASYKKTLEHVFRKSTMTHLAALNLGLDMCAALAVCRRSGYLYVDLKPDNIFVYGDKEFRIGDLGFLSLDALRYTSLPDKYRSAYTAPEITDAFSALNATIDIYAAGLILYQAYNNGALPVAADDGSFPAPAYGDYEISEIILKACALNPEDRWQDPIQMGQAIVGYMQRNGANDTPIIPVAQPEEVAAEDTVENVDEGGIYLEETNEDVSSVPAITEDGNVADETTAEDTATDVPTEEQSFEENDASTEEEEELIIQEDEIFSEDEHGNLTFLDDSEENSAEDESAPGNDSSDLEYDEVSEEVSQMLNQADDLIAHEAPQPVVAPEPIDIPIPEPIVIEDSVEEATEETQTSEDPTEDPDEEPVADDTVDDIKETEEIINEQSEPEDAETDITAPVKSTHWVRNLIIILSIIALLVAGWFFYRNYYLQPVSMVLQDNNGVLTVLVESQIDEEKLTVVCSDTYGIQHTAPVKNGMAVFEDLVPNSAYTVKVTIEGFHQLVGKTSTGYTTPEQTNIVQISAITGPEDGSAIIGFTIDGPDSQQWIVQYVTDGEDVKEIVFTGHMVTVSGLTIGNQYDFTLLPCDDILITGNNLVSHTASKIICASDLSVTSFADGVLSVSWKAPEDAAVESWTVRCYNVNGYDESIVTSELTADFGEIIQAEGYTVEVTATGMSVSQRVEITDNSIHIADIAVVPSDPGSIGLKWESDLQIDSAGWKIVYRANGGEPQELTATENEIVIPSVIPEGEYEIDILSVSGITVFNGSIHCTAPEAQEFAGFGITADDMDFYMCRTPNVSPWGAGDLSRYDYITAFSVDEKASFLIRLNDDIEQSDEPLNVLFTIKDAETQTLSCISANYVWSDFWKDDCAALDLPWLPDTAGHYYVSICFNGMLAFDLGFDIY